MASETNVDAFDVVIVGGGSAGAVLANRLSADGTRRVLLLEAGQAYAPSAYPDVIANANRVGGDEVHGWGYHTEDHLGLGHDVNAIRGKVLGGSSGVNAAVAMRARPSDFARWTARGVEGWSWDDVFPISRQWRTRRRATMLGTGGRALSPFGSGRWKRSRPPCAPSSWLLKRSGWRG